MKFCNYVITLTVVAMIATACGNTAKNDGKSVENDSINAATAAVVEDSDDVATSRRGIDDIRESWKDKPIKVDAGKSEYGIKQLTQAFCKTFPQCKTNEALNVYFTDQEATGEDTYNVEVPWEDSDDRMVTFAIDCQPRNGYLRCMAEVQTDRFTYACFWNRRNGHKLFVVFMEECWESASWNQCLAVFYDFDPATAILTPEPELTDMIEKRMKDYDFYSIVLPEKGADITVIAFTEIQDEEDEEETGGYAELKLKWNGMTFDWEK